MEKTNVKPAEGKLGIMVVGCGAVATTFMTGVLMTRKGLAKPIGSMTQYDKIRVGKGADKKYLHYKDIVPLAKLEDIVFGTLPDCKSTNLIRQSKVIRRFFCIPKWRLSHYFRIERVTWAKCKM